MNSLFATIFYAITSFGDEAVAVFFAISGFLVGGACLKAFREGNFSTGRYLIDRFSRIYIVFIPAILITVAADYFLENMKPGYVDMLICNVVNLQNNVCEALPANGPLWSLSCEWFYYLTFPLIILCIYRFGEHRVLSIAILALVVFVSANFGRVSLFGHIAWIFGALAAMVRVTGGRRIAAFAGFIALPVLAQGLFMNSRLGFLLIASGFALLLSLRIDRGVPVEWLMRLNHSLSNVSFSLYVVHSPVILIIFRFFPGMEKSSVVSFDSVLMSLTIYAVCLLAAYSLAFMTEWRTAALRRKLHSAFLSGAR